MNQQLDLDPLNSYDFQNYGYPAYIPQYYPKPDVPYQSLPLPNQPDTILNISETHDTQNTSENLDNTDTNVENDSEKKKAGKNKQKKNTWSEKIADASFPFYGCSICNISYTVLSELDQHVTIHKNRLTSYRLRVRNQLKKKQLRKEKRKLKKLIKIKTEVDIVDIKPEDGYIGNEKAAEYSDSGVNSGINSENTVNQNPVSFNIPINPENINPDLNTYQNSVQNHSDTCNTNSDYQNTLNTNPGDTNSGTCDSNEKNVTSDKKIDNNEDFEKIYKCFACQKKFQLSYYLKLHVRSHTDEKPYACNACDQRFITASHLGRHNKRIHLAARFQCRICFKVFSRFELLTAHFDKKHADDKLEGEPYDYNAILPYLKDLEGQLMEPAELQETEKKEGEPWPSAGLESGQDIQPPIEEKPEIKPEIPIEHEYEFVTEKKEDPDYTDDDNGDNQITGDDYQNTDYELQNMDFDHQTLGQGHQNMGHGHQNMDNDHQNDENDNNDQKDEDYKPLCKVKDESSSDEDYFPSNTWIASPKEDPSSPPPPTKKKTKKKLTKTCEICQKEVSSASYMRVHLRTHTGEKPFKCYKCGSGFITRSKMHRHIISVHQGVVQDAIMKTEESIKTEGDENDDEPLIKIKKERKSKKKVGDTVPSGRPHACEYCHQKFRHIHMLEVHKKSHVGQPLSCHFCLEEFKDCDAVKEHQTVHVGPKPYLCTLCGKSYKNRAILLYHRKDHKPVREFICDICSKHFNAFCKLQKHIVTHRSDKYVLRYECPVCAHMFNTKWHTHMHLGTHMKEGLILEENRNEILAMVLQNARKIPKNADATQNLTDIMPSDERSRVCNICGEVFQHFYYLEEHLKSHGSKIALNMDNDVEERKHICPICSKGFKLHYYLKLHSYTHSKEKPFVCQQCGKGFITRGKLKRHLETHSGLKKYQCHICYKFFTRPSYLRIHIRTIHGTQDFNFTNFLNNSVV